MRFITEYISNAFSIHKDQSPKYLIYFVTSYCNATCYFCHYKTQIDDPVRKSHELTLEEIEKLSRNYGKVSKLSFSGGEPFLRADIDEIIELFIRHCDPKIIDIPTNGSMPEKVEQTVKRIMPQMGGRILDIQLSIDGPEEIHDRVRGIPGLFKKIIETYQRLNNLRKNYSNLKIKLNLVYLPDNKDSIEGLMTFFEKDFDFDRFQITYPHGKSVDGSITQSQDFKDFKELSQKIQRHYKIIDRTDLHSLVFRSVKMLRDDVLADHHSDLGAVCKAGERVLVLDDTGGVYPCEPLWESVGNVRDTDYDIHKILNGPKMQEFKLKHLGPNKCNCHWGCAALEKVIYSPSMYPKLLTNLAYLATFGGRGLTINGKKPGSS